MNSNRDSQRLIKRVLAVMSSRTGRERANVTRLEDALQQAEQQHQNSQQALVDENDRYRSGRAELSEKLRMQTRTVSDLNRYQRELSGLNAIISQAEEGVRSAATAEASAHEHLQGGRRDLRQALLREEKWRIASRSISQGVHHENG